MTPKRNRLSILLVLILTLARSGVFSEHAWASKEDDKDEAHPGDQGKKAVLQVSDESGIQLSAPAIKTLGLKLEKLSAVDGASIQVPVSSLIYFQDEVGVYRLRAGWFKLIEFKVQKRTANMATITSQEFKEGDEIVVQGAPLLRVADLQARGGPVDTD